MPAPRTLQEAFPLAADRGTGWFVFHLDDGPRRMDVGELCAASVARATHLIDGGVKPGDPIGLLGPDRPEWVEWAGGVWMAGAALVPLPAPIRVRDADAFSTQIAMITAAAGCTRVVVHPRFAGSVNPEVVEDWDGRGPAADTEALPQRSPTDLAAVMFTSGSTSTPKGVRLTHATLLGRTLSGLVNEDRLASPTVRILAWLPFFHSGGLAAIVSPVLDGCEGHFLPAERFARDPGAWFRLVGEVGATHTGAPSSGWAAAIRAASRHPEGIDLSSLQMAGFSMEMVDPDVLDQLLEVGVPLGLRPEVLMSAYGQSEGPGVVTRLGTGIRIDPVDLDELVSSGAAIGPRPGRPVKRVASCGSPVPGVELRIGNPDAPLGERQVGEILLRGRGMMDGYANADAVDPIRDGWLWTGDLGYVADGELFVTGRSSEIIIHQGRNFHPEDIEWAVTRAIGIGPEDCVAFAPHGAEEGEVVVIVGSDAGDEIGVQVRAAVTNAVGITPRRVMVVPPGMIPRAANGKAQRLAARDAYERGDLGAPAPA